MERFAPSNAPSLLCRLNSVVSPPNAGLWTFRRWLVYFYRNRVSGSGIVPAWKFRFLNPAQDRLLDGRFSPFRNPAIIGRNDWIDHVENAIHRCRIAKVRRCQHTLGLVIVLQFAQNLDNYKVPALFRWANLHETTIAHGLKGRVKPLANIRRAWLPDLFDAGAIRVR